jgi:hypothetical protein
LSEHEDFNLEELFSGFDAEQIVADQEQVMVDEATAMIRESWSIVTNVGAGIYKDSKENGLPEPVAQWIAKEFLASAIMRLRGEDA